ncbi:MAG: hypothetical protein RMI89_02710 [Gloeomargarita sp. SKYBB_i_bin120]|nr:hypothetical protein [Gloeomargarita sp. SKYG98]MCS7291871.1 hypothetical protein [Gloeomargarita sp. SKYB120]MDW8177431.1 hypothetical protein [Gloeomargarita sp. SKYBB_i_bin120]
MPGVVMGLLMAQVCSPWIGTPEPAGFGFNSSQRFFSLGQQRLEQEMCRLYQAPTPSLEISPTVAPADGASPSSQ